jgi:hypothetical protein
MKSRGKRQLLGSRHLLEIKRGKYGDKNQQASFDQIDEESHVCSPG